MKLNPGVAKLGQAYDGPPSPSEGSTRYGVTGWLVWPGRFLDRNDPSLEVQLSADMDEVLAMLNGDRDWAPPPGRGTRHGLRLLDRHGGPHPGAVGAPFPRHLDWATYQISSVLLMINILAINGSLWLEY